MSLSEPSSMQAFYFDSYPSCHPRLRAINTTIGERLRALRAARKLSAIRVAGLLTMSVGYLYQLERGEKEFNCFLIFKWVALLATTGDELREVLELWATYNEEEDILVHEITRVIRSVASLDFDETDLDDACFLASWLDKREKREWGAVKQALIGLGADAKRGP